MVNSISVAGPGESGRETFAHVMDFEWTGVLSARLPGGTLSMVQFQRESPVSEREL